ncbi:hypothetical protein D3273_25835 [Lichenibacterium minor]|uniref:Uncharacterized protein n=1 Tax=Lichenibacterium minor TaxID=2316528 RepID=A0A4Q2TZB8_9HYPH|nr:hypothetical protein [Lichenibacterium minor]RYC29100.1 hypothetical protein D3273_25835 [Lichenibacterium minor]
MTDRATLHVFLLFAQALKASRPFDAIRVFDLLKRLRAEAGLHIDEHMDAAMKASVAAMASRESHSVAVARYTLERVIIELEGMLDMDAA